MDYTYVGKENFSALHSQTLTDVDAAELRFRAPTHQLLRCFINEARNYSGHTWDLFERTPNSSDTESTSAVSAPFLYDFSRVGGVVRRRDE